MSRFFVPKQAVRGKNITVSGREAHHILDVMRLKKSDKVITFDGSGKEYAGVITETHPGSLTIEITAVKDSPLTDLPQITLIQAVPKKDKMDYIVEKSTELGVEALLPALTERTIVRWGADKKRASGERWRRIAEAASKQCGRPCLPYIGEVMELGHAFEFCAGYDLKLIAALSEDSIPVKKAIRGFKGRKAVVAIGPEGDFTAEEVKEARKAGFKLIGLGPRVLKSDTAGLAALAILNYEFSD